MYDTLSRGCNKGLHAFHPDSAQLGIHSALVISCPTVPFFHDRQDAFEKPDLVTPHEIFSSNGSDRRRSLLRVFGRLGIDVMRYVPLL